jgi:hypothetical protein
LIEAAAIAAGVAFYNFRWSQVRAWIASRTSSGSGGGRISGSEERGSLASRAEA